MKNRVATLLSRRSAFTRAVAAALLLALVPAARAGVTPLAYWRLGEIDPGASPGLPAATTQNQVNGGGALTLTGAIAYTHGISPDAAEQTGSRLGLSFQAGAVGESTLVSTLTDNFGIELWVLPASIHGNQCLAYNGDTGGSGWGLYVAGGQFQALLGGVSLFPGAGAPVIPSAWTHLALVRDRGTNTFYVNGTPVGINTLAPNIPTGRFAVGAPPQGVNLEFFTGGLDEVRVFAFAPGEFNPYDLLLARLAPPAGTVWPTDLGGNHATLNAWVHPARRATTVWFEWGTTTNYNHATTRSNLMAADAVQSVSQNLTGLVVGATYHYRVAASNAVGVNYGVDLSFTTPIFVDLTETLPQSLRDRGGGAVAWADFDNDGRLDLLAAGPRFYPPVSRLLRNTGNGFVDVTATLAPNLPDVEIASVAWGDFDNDGRLDFLLCGYARNGTVTQLWRNTGSGFTNVTASVAPGLPPVAWGAVAWADFDNDGRLDFFVTGARPDFSWVSQLWRNTGSGFVNVTAELAPGLPDLGPRGPSAVVWGDYDNDGRPDFLLSGYSAGTSVSQLWRNTGNGFTNVTDSVAPGGLGDDGGFWAWGDYDNDGRLDLLHTGDDSPVTQLWRNTGSGFTNVTESVVPHLPQFFKSAVAWVDYDNDGRLDFLVAGSTNHFFSAPGVRQLWRNTGTGFTNVMDAPTLVLSGYGRPSIAWGDFDSDGRVDFLLAAEYPWGNSGIELWRNETPVTNNPPAAPGGLAAAVSGPGVTFTWNAASDAETPPNGLAYHLRVGTTPGGSELSNPMAAGSGQARLPRTDALRPARARTLTGLPMAQTIYWSVQAADTAFAGSPFAPEQSFTLGVALAPTNGVVLPGDANGDGVVSPEEFAAVRARLTNEVATENAAGYYRPAQVQALSLGSPRLNQLATDQFKLTLGLQKAAQLTNHVPFPLLAPQTTINAQGELEFRFTAPDNAAFYRLEAR